MYYPAKKFKPFGEMSSYGIACKVGKWYPACRHVAHTRKGG
jgi:hypothetical protein